MPLKPRTIPGWPRALCEDWAAAYVGQLSVSAFRAEVKAGRIPKAVQLTAGRLAWLLDDLDAYLDGKRGRPSDPAREASLEHLAAEWDLACDGDRATRLS
jgi:predicted DNA-binding transcriptional regulator AlpA